MANTIKEVYLTSHRGWLVEQVIAVKSGVWLLTYQGELARLRVENTLNPDACVIYPTTVWTSIGRGQRAVRQLNQRYNTDKFGLRFVSANDVQDQGSNTTAET